MAHISSIGAGLYTDLAVGVKTGDGTWTSAELAAFNSSATWLNITTGPFCGSEVAANGTVAAAVGQFVRIQNVREFPSIGTPANIVQVAQYGSKTSRQVQGQADAPTIEITLNYVPNDWSSTSVLGKKVADGNQYPIRFALLNAQPTAYGSLVAGLGTKENSQWFWVGKLESLLINPQLTDANTATLTISVQSDFYGSYTI
jgi:hypothetical protein